MERISKLLKKRISEVGISQHKLANRLNMDVKTINRMCNGKECNFDSLMRMIDGLNVEISFKEREKDEF